MTRNRQWIVLTLALMLLGEGELKRALTVKVDKCSAKAREIVEAAGGTIEVADSSR